MIASSEHGHILAALCALNHARDREIADLREHFLRVAESELAALIDPGEFQNFLALSHYQETIPMNLELI